jgi:hypothetical protein
MANVLNNYNPQYWANQALMLLTTRKGYASRVFRGYEEERSTFGRGDVINFRKPMQFTAQDIMTGAPTATTLDTPKTSLTLNSHEAVFFSVTDKDLTFAGDRIITDHIAPAVDALAQKMDMDIAGALASKVPHIQAGVTLSSINAAELLSEVRQLMVENKVPRDGKALTYVAQPATMALMLQNSSFTQFQGADGVGVAAQVSGELGRKFGFDWFETTNTVAHAAAANPADAVGTLGVTVGAGSLTVDFDDLTNAEEIAIGSIITIDGDKYVLAAAHTISGTTGTLSLETPTRKGYASGVALLFTTDAVAAIAAQDIVFHPNAAALVVAPLPMHSSSLGANVYTATDPATGLSVRARMNYDNVNGDVNVIFDVLYGIQVIDENLAVRVDIT